MATKKKPTKKANKPTSKKKASIKRKSKSDIKNWDSKVYSNKTTPPKAPKKRKSQQKQVKFDYTTAA